MKTVFVNPERCLGCRQCEFACAVEHSVSRAAASAVFEEPLPRARVHVEAAGAWAFPVRCRHCTPAPCEAVCPTGAIARGEQDLVLVDARRCIGCALCGIVCPVSAVTYHPKAGAGPRPVATKCDGCLERTRVGRLPACAEACKSGALVYGELNELVRAGRVREACLALAAAAGRSSAAPDSVRGWRALGLAARQLAEGFSSSEQRGG